MKKHTFLLEVTELPDNELGIYLHINGNPGVIADDFISALNEKKEVILIFKNISDKLNNYEKTNRQTSC